MRRKTWPPPLTIAKPTPITPPPPPRELSGPGRDLWNKVLRDYRIDDSASQEALQQACEALNRLEGLAAQIRADGEVIADGKGGHRSHPCLREEILNRGFVLKTLKTLGVLNGPKLG
jgi:hypothetical protein